MWAAHKRMFVLHNEPEPIQSRSLLLASIFSSLLYALLLLFLGMRFFDPYQTQSPIKTKMPAPIKLLPQKKDELKSEKEPEPKAPLPPPPHQQTPAASHKQQPPTEILQLPPRPTTEKNEIIPTEQVAPQSAPERTTPLKKTSEKTTTTQTPKKRNRRQTWKLPSISAPAAQREEQKTSKTSSEAIHTEFAQFLEEKNEKTLFVQSKTKTNNPYYWGQSAEKSAQHAEDLSFFDHLCFSFCDLSYQNQLPLAGIVIQPHPIVIMVTVTKNRKIKDTTITQASPIPQINQHILKLLRQITPPILPAHHTGEELIVPLYIEMHGNSTKKTLYFQPLRN